MDGLATLLTIAVALFMGLMMTRLFKYLHWQLPDVTAFLIAGLVVGPYALGRLDVPGLGFASIASEEEFSIISDVALGFIAFDIGSEFRLSELRKNGRQATVIGIVQSVFAAVLVDVVLIAMHFALGDDALPLDVALELGAIASATAPAATLMVVRQYKADGPVTDLLLPIVALDDAVGLVIFAVSNGVAHAIGGGEINAVSVVLEPMLKIIASLVLGALMGVLLTALEKLFYSNANRLNMTITFVFMTLAFAGLEFGIGSVHIGFSSLLVCMMMGTVFCNMSEFSEDIMERSERWTSPLYALFFVLSGAELDIRVLGIGSVVLIGAVYIITRAAGKYIGASVCSRLMGCEPAVQKYLGITLFPQAGVALGMVILAQSLGEQQGAMIRNIILMSVLVYELVGPLLTKWALTRAGEIKAQSADTTTRERFRIIRAFRH